MSDDQPARRDPFLPLIALVTLLGAALRVKVGATEPPHFDESYTAVHYVLESARTIVTTYDEPNNHILHSLLAWISTGLFGNGPFALRLPALLAGIALVPATGLLARATVRHARQRGADVAGLVAAGIVAAAPPLIAYSANARGYTMVLLLMVVQLGLTLRLTATVDPPASEAETTSEAGTAAEAETTPETAKETTVEPAAVRSRGRLWAAWVAFGALAIWTVPTAVLGVGVAAIWLVALRGGPARRLLAPIAAVAASGALAVALYSPVLGQRGFTVDRFTAAPVRELATTLTHAWAAGLAAPLIAVAVVLALFGLARRPQLGPSATLAIGLVALPIVIAALGRVLPYSRTYLFLLPILAVLAGVGAARLVPQLERRGRVAARGSAVALALLAFLAGATAQTREAWGEDPPGPSRGDLASAMQATFEPATRPTVQYVLGAVYSLPNDVFVPPFDLPQVQYALVQGITDDRAPMRRADVLARGLASPPADRDLVIATRSGVAADVALAALGLDPAAFASSAIRRGDAQVISARRR